MTSPSPAASRPGPIARSRGRLRRRAAWLVAAGSALALAWLATRFDPLGTAHAAYDRKEFAAALVAARAHLSRWPGDRRASLMAARSLAGLGAIDQAEPYYDKAGPLGPDDLHARAFALIRLNRPGRAAELYEELLARWPGDPLALQRLGSIRIGQKAWRDVVSVGERLIRTSAGAVPGWTMIGIAYHEKKNYASAASAFAKVLEIDPGLRSMPLPRPLFWANYATDILAEGRIAEARAHLERALDDRRDPALLELLGQSYQLEGREDRAEACWREALAIDRDNVPAMLDLGQLALNRRSLPEAVGLLTRAAELDPDQVEPNYRLGQALRASGDVLAADRYARRADELRRARSSAAGR